MYSTEQEKRNETNPKRKFALQYQNLLSNKGRHSLKKRFSIKYRKLKLDLSQWLIKPEDDLQRLRELKESIPKEQK